MPTNRKTRADSTTAAVYAARTARAPIPKPPIALSDDALAFWPGIVSALAAEELTPPIAFAAAQLALIEAEIVRESQTLATEGLVIDGRANPRHKLLDDLRKSELAFLRSLRLAGTPAGDTRDKTPQRRLERQAKANAAGHDDDELLA